MKNPYLQEATESIRGWLVPIDGRGVKALQK